MNPTDRESWDGDEGWARSSTHGSGIGWLEPTMMVLTELAPHYRVPGGSAHVRLEGGHVMDASGVREAGRLTPGYRQIEWFWADQGDLARRVSSEREVFDDWAEAERARIVEEVVPLAEASRNRSWWDYPLYDEPGIENTIANVPDLRDLAGSRILDIGGSLKDSWRFVWHGDAALVDHVEVSGVTQQLGLERLRGLFSEKPQLLDRFTFHVVPAERLPFADDSFDLVFSRSTIHHTSRPAVFEEIHRVLRPGGVFWMLEPRFPLLVYAMMRLGRAIRRVDRGTDDPLRSWELREMARMLPIEAIFGTKILGPYVDFILGKRSRGGRRGASVDRALSSTAFGRWLAHFVSVVARKPTDPPGLTIQNP